MDAALERRNAEVLGKMLPLAREIREHALRIWPDRPPLELFGRSPALQALLEKLVKFARHDDPILILGESGAGKELIARACYLCSPRAKREFVAVNCPQQSDTNMAVSELFGHRKGAFTGAATDRKGLFETADGGVIFLDEIADLPLPTQVMLLRALAEGEFRRLGDSETRRVNTRVVAATNRSLKDLVVQREFRHDLYFRLAYFPLHVPPLRERGEDWQLITEAMLLRLAERYGVLKTLAPAAVEALHGFPWPGNIRQLQAAVKVGYSNAEGSVIQYEDVRAALSWTSEAEAAVASAAPGQNGHGDATATSPLPLTMESLGGDGVQEYYDAMVKRGGSFWEVVGEPFLNRELNRQQVRRLIWLGLAASGGNYKSLLRLFHLQDDAYQKFMDFLRTHRLKVEPDDRRAMR